MTDHKKPGSTQKFVLILECDITHRLHILICVFYIKYNSCNCEGGLVV